ncbi:MAG TPA: ArsR family transcriptional regulator, partial [Candidatus Limnocylindria bacterium]|nr:ArsR family transcriptional regulator [Candidatus Limnocylindria bacterium]
EHLDLLVEAGLVRRETAPAAGRGRPGLRYSAEPRERADDPQAYRALASVLASELARRPDARAAATSACERWGEAAAATLPTARTDSDALDRLVDLLDDAGFAPSRSVSSPEAIQLHRCPFGSLARERADVVCNVHLGLMRGALRELGSPLDAVSLQPFVRPDLCLAHIGARTHDD